MLVGHLHFAELGSAGGSRPPEQAQKEKPQPREIHGAWLEAAERDGAHARDGVGRGERRDAAPAAPDHGLSTQCRDRPVVEVGENVLAGAGDQLLVMPAGPAAAETASALMLDEWRAGDNRARQGRGNEMRPDKSPMGVGEATDAFFGH